MSGVSCCKRVASPRRPLSVQSQHMLFSASWHLGLRDGDDDFWRAWPIVSALSSPARISVTAGCAGGRVFVASFFVAGCFSKVNTLRLGKKVIMSCFSPSEIAPQDIACFNAVCHNLVIVLKCFLDQQPKEHLAGMPRMPSLYTFSLGQMPG